MSVSNQSITPVTDTAHFTIITMKLQLPFLHRHHHHSLLPPTGIHAAQKIHPLLRLDHHRFPRPLHPIATSKLVVTSMQNQNYYEKQIPKHDSAQPTT